MFVKSINDSTLIYIKLLMLSSLYFPFSTSLCLFCTEMVQALWLLFFLLSFSQKSYYLSFYLDFCATKMFLESIKHYKNYLFHCFLYFCGFLLFFLNILELIREPPSEYNILPHQEFLFLDIKPSLNNAILDFISILRYLFQGLI